MKTLIILLMLAVPTSASAACTLFEILMGGTWQCNLYDTGSGDWATDGWSGGGSGGGGGGGWSGTGDTTTEPPKDEVQGN